MLKEAERSRDGSQDGWVAVWVAEAIPRRHHLDQPALVVLVEVLVVDARASGAGSKEVAAVEEADFAVKIEDFAAVVAALGVVAVIVALANKTAMPLLTPQPDRDLTIGLGVIVNVIVTAVTAVTAVTDSSVVGITYALVPAHLMTDLVDPRRDSTEIDEQAPTSSLSVTGASTATTTALEMTTTGSAGTKAATKIPESFAATKGHLLSRHHLAVLVGMCYLPVFRNCYSDFSFFSLPFVTKGKQG